MHRFPRPVYFRSGKAIAILSFNVFPFGAQAGDRLKIIPLPAKNYDTESPVTIIGKTESEITVGLNIFYSQRCNLDSNIHTKHNNTLQSKNKLSKFCAFNVGKCNS